MFFDNKVVLGFEEEFTIYRAKAWIRSYNLAHVLKLEVYHELPNSLFVVKFETADIQAAKTALLASSPLRVGDIYASVNDYDLSFDPCNQSEFRHLVTVNIPRGNPAIFSLIRCFIHVVGTYVKAVLGPDLRHISVIVESRLKLFPAHGLFKLPKSEVTTIFFDYEGRNLRCCYCFSYHHFPSDCKEPRPPFFSSPDLKLDSASGETSGEPALGPEGNAGVQLDRSLAGARSNEVDLNGKAALTTGARKAKFKRGRPRDRTQTFGDSNAASAGGPMESVEGDQTGLAHGGDVASQ